ncbi:hypothetical protein [Streptomyces sp. NPDC058240]|uniref:hypothetical protein n=1 Tax=Streptomyces sp. NPDC058240 TaxID=3346396 RepID=UPI0036E77DDF
MPSSSSMTRTVTVVSPAGLDRRGDPVGVPVGLVHTGQGCGVNRLRLRGLLADGRDGDSFLAELLLLGDTGLADGFVSLGAGGGFGGEVGGRAQVTLSESCIRGT